MANKPMPSVWSPGFIDFMKVVENAPLAAGEANLLHDSPEGGTKTWGYGHKLDLVEQSSQQLKNGTRFDAATEEDAEIALRGDLRAAETRNRHQIGPKYDTLSRRAKEMLTDFTFNLGSAARSFPNFTAAVLKGDLEAQRKEYKRYFKDEKGNTKEIKDRNDRFFERYLSDDALKKWATGEV